MKTMRKGLAVLLAMTLCLSLLPAGALAADGGWDTEITIPANPGMEWGSTTEVSISKDPYSWGGSETYDTEWYNNDPNAAEYTINTAAELAGLAYITNSDTGTYANEQFAGKTIKLGVDIDLQESSVTILDRDYNVNEGLTLKAWTPIGTSSNEFQGTFDGNNYTISGLYMPSSTSTRRYGLFGCADGATIQNLTLEDSYIYCSTDDASIRASGTHVGGI